MHPYLHKRLHEEVAELPSQIDAPVPLSESVGLLVASTIAGAAIDAAAPGFGLIFGLTMNFLGDSRPSTEVLEPNLREAVYKDFFRRRPIRAFTPSPKNLEAWNHFLKKHWSSLQGHGHVPVPLELCDPKDVGFTPTKLAAFVGQDEDLVLALPDRSRLHVHGFRGRYEVHRDTLDPARGPVVALWHWLTETPEGQLTSGAVATAALAWWVLDENDGTGVKPSRP